MPSHPTRDRDDISPRRSLVNERFIPRGAVLSPADLARELEDPLCRERWSILTGDPLLLVDLEGEPASSEGPWRRRLSQLPVVTAALGSPPRESSVLAEQVDLRISEAELPRLEAMLARQPQACLALAQLLRGASARSLHEGLVSESLVYSTLQSGPEFAAWLRGHPHKSSEPAVRPPLEVAREGERLCLRLDRPEKRNAFSAEMRDALCEALALALADPSIREVEISGAGPAFCSGGDLDEFGTLPDPATAHVIRATRNPARLLAGCADRVRFRVHGACIGAGVELPSFGAHVSAREDTFFHLPEVSMGLVPGAGGTVSLPRRIGRQRTAWMALTGARVDVATALAWGLIDAVES